MNRIRASTALQTNSVWTDIIGQQQHEWAGSNAEVEKAVNAPKVNRQGKTGMSRTEAAQELLEKTGGFGTGKTIDDIMAMAKQRAGALGPGAGGVSTRGACKKCGAAGHLTKDCRNFLSDTFKSDQERANHETLDAGGADAGPTLSDITLDSSEYDSDVEQPRKRQRDEKDSRTDRKRRKEERRQRRHERAESRKERRRDESNRLRSPRRGSTDRDREETRDHRRDRDSSRDRRRDRKD